MQELQQEGGMLSENKKAHSRQRIRFSDFRHNNYNLLINIASLGRKVKKMGIFCPILDSIRLLS